MKFREKDLNPDRHLRDALMGEILRPLLDAARRTTQADECNLLCIAPAAWGIAWMSSSGAQHRQETELPTPDLPSTLPPAPKMHAHLFQRATDLINRHHLKAYAWAQQCLGRAIFPLTGRVHSTTSPTRALWCPTSACSLSSTHGDRAPTLFQTALEWAASGHKNEILEDDPFIRTHLLQRGRVISTTTRRSLRIDQFANRPGLVDRDNYHQFLAEHIRILGQSDAGLRDLDDPTIESHFLPIRCLGQWRAALDLKGISTRHDRQQQSERPPSDRLGFTFMFPALERLLAYAVVSAFRHAIDAFNFIRGPLVSDLRSLLPFTVLWWSKEILFVQDRKTRARLFRYHSGEFGLDEMAPMPPKHAPGESFLSRFDIERQWDGGWIVMNLRQIGSGLTRAVFGSWGFDEVHFRVPMLDRQIRPDEWARIEYVVQTAVRRTLRSRFYSIDAQEAQENFNRLTYLSHGIGNSLNAANNRLYSLVQELADLDKDNLSTRIDPIRNKAAAVGRQLREAQGLAYFARTGLRELESGPPQDWMRQPGEVSWTREEALSAMHDVLAHYLGAYESRDETMNMWLVFFVGQSRFDYSLGALGDVAKQPTQLTLPPFSRRRLNDIRGGAPLFLLTLGLAEILRNARSQLVNFWHHYAEALAPDVPRLIVDLEVSEQCDITVVVCGLARPKHNLHSVSLARIIRAERSLPPRRRLMISEQAIVVASETASPLHHPDSGFVRTVARWRFFASTAQAQLSRDPNEAPL